MRGIARSRGMVVLDAPLLFETGADRMCDAIVFLDAPRRLRRLRATKRGITPGEAARRERLQWSTASKKRRADYVIDNTGPISRTKEQARKIYVELNGLLDRRRRRN